CQLAAGDVQCWGADEVAQLGTLGVGPRPHRVPGLTGQSWTRLVPTHGKSECALLGAGQQGYCWGFDPIAAFATTPYREPLVDTARAISLGFGCAYLLDGNGMLYARGDNAANQFGDPAPMSSAVPVAL